MLQDGKIWVGSSGKTPVTLLPNMANRHGLIAGATGTGKTVTLKVMAEGFSDMGVPVFLSDIKGDLSGMVRMGHQTDKLASRLLDAGVTSFPFKDYPTEFWDVYGEQGTPVRTTISEMGPLLLARMLNLNDTQSGVLNILFRVACDEGLLLLDIKDVKAMLAYVGENAQRYTLNYGNVTKATIGAIQRAVAVLEDQGGDRFFGEPALSIQDWMQVDENGRGVINILACDRLFLSPLMYSTFLLWMLSDLYETLPEVGDMDKPRMVFFFDEAHLLFNDCSRQLMDKIEQVVRLIRSKGVGVYFITQNPTDVPMSILGQLGNRVQHALRAYTPLDQRAVKVAAQTFRTNPAFDTEEAITQLKTGEALISFLDEGGAPTIVTRATILPPQSDMGAIDAALRQTFMDTSRYKDEYTQTVDRESAYEKLASVLNLSMRPDRGLAQTYQQPATTFMVFDRATNSYIAKTVPDVSSATQTMEVSQPMNSEPMNPAEEAQQPVQPVYQQPVYQQPVYQQPTVAQPVYKTTATPVGQPVEPLYQQPVQPVYQQPVAGQPVYQAQPVAAQPVYQQPAAGQPVYQQPVAGQPVYQQPVQQAQPQTIRQNVFVQDPATGAYVQKEMTMALDPTTGQYVPVMTEAEAKAAAKAAKEAAAAQAKEAAAAAKAEKEAEAAERREHSDDLREERAERARRNDSVLGRVKNTAISSATRSVVNSLTKDLMKTLTGKK